MAIYTYVYIPGILHARRPVPEPEKSIEEIVQSHGAKAFARFAVNVVRRKNRPRTTGLTLGGVRKLPAAWLLEVGTYVTNRCEILGDETI